jgi:hypothetical protein
MSGNIYLGNDGPPTRRSRQKLDFQRPAVRVVCDECGWKSDPMPLATYKGSSELEAIKDDHEATCPGAPE